jgi:adenylate cyclase class 2
MQPDATPVIHEVEVKYRVADATAAEAGLLARGVILGDAILQDDQAYAPVTWSYGMPRIGVTFARLRTQNGRHLFTVKRPVTNDLDCREHETVVDDRAQMHQAVQLMGVAPTVRIVKRRRTVRWADAEVCLDEVDGLGGFLELERLVCAGQNAESVQHDLDAMVRTLGVGVERTLATYDALLLVPAAPPDVASSGLHS